MGFDNRFVSGEGEAADAIECCILRRLTEIKGLLTDFLKKKK